MIAAGFCCRHPGRFISETVLVPTGDGEGRGLVYDARAHRSELRLLDPARPGLELVARIPLRHHVPFGFHSRWVPTATAPDS